MSSLRIIPYRGYGTATRILVHGRVVRKKDLGVADAGDSVWRNLLNTWKRIDSDSLPFAKVTLRVGDNTHEITADDEGFFREWFDLAQPLSAGDEWVNAELRLQHHDGDVNASAPIRMLTSTPDFGVISDLDDTVIQSRVTSFLQALRTVMLGNARTRLPFPGVAAFYRALEGGNDGKRCNPIFYVSSSPWNIYDLISDFMDFQKIPAGPIHLRDWDFSLGALRASRLLKHKEPIIRDILDLFPTLNFILIGDDSQSDPEIYKAVLDAYPKRILAIYIRNVRADPERSASLKLLADQVLAAGSSLLLADDTFAAASHAAEQGWIEKSRLDDVHEEKRADTGVSGAKADVPGDTNEGEARTVVVE